MWEMIDLKADPLETEKFYNDPAYAAVQKVLHAGLDRLREQYCVPEDDPASRERGKNWV